MEQNVNQNDERLSRFYLKCDVLLLAYVFEKFRNNSLKNYGLFPGNCFSVPPLGWDGMLNMYKAELELIPDPNMYIFFEDRYKRWSVL